MPGNSGICFLLRCQTGTAIHSLGWGTVWGSWTRVRHAASWCMGWAVPGAHNREPPVTAHPNRTADDHSRPLLSGWLMLFWRGQGSEAKKKSFCT